MLLSLDEDKQLCGISQASLGSERSLSEKTRLLHRDRLSPPSQCLAFPDRVWRLSGTYATVVTSV
jgi:hypothetical protein